MKNNLNRHIPAVHKILTDAGIALLINEFGKTIVADSIRAYLEQLRTNEQELIPLAGEIIGNIHQTILAKTKTSYRQVINATGVILHTNLGRAPLSGQLVKELENLISGYSNLEYDLASGLRGERQAHLKELLSMLTGTASNMLVNNNAAAVMLALNTLAAGKEVIISRGELVEIGGSFRIPSIIEASGAILKEVGTTNKTHAHDYIEAINANTGLIFKAHKSNYEISGFTSSVGIAELAKISKTHAVPLVYDMGSGLTTRVKIDLDTCEESIEEILACDVDVLTFSCDKLLGGPQGGIICGKEKYIKAMQKMPLARAFRVGKLTIAAMTISLKEFFGGRTPTQLLIKKTSEEVYAAAQKLQECLLMHGVSTEIIPHEARCGGGTLPGHTFPGYALSINLSAEKLQKVMTAMRNLPRPIISIALQGRLALNLLTINPADFDYIAKSIAKVI